MKNTKNLIVILVMGLIVPFSCTKSDVQDPSDVKGDKSIKTSIRVDSSLSSVSLNSNVLRTQISPTNKKEKPLQATQSTNTQGTISSSVTTLSTATYTCGSSLNGSYAGSGYYKYPTYLLDLSGTEKGSNISLNVSSYDVPNKFTVYDANGNYVAGTSWMGYSSGSGPWGPSLNTQQSQVFSFNITCSSSSNSYSLVVETVTQGYSDAWDASITCKDPTQVTVVSETNTTVRSKMISTFRNLKVDFAKLSVELGLSRTLTENDIDFNNLKRCQIVDDCDAGVAIFAPFKSNATNTSVQYGYMITTDATNSTYSLPMMTRVVPNQSKKYLDLMGGKVLTINNYSSNTISSQIVTGNYMLQIMGGCGDATINCISDVYSRRGWISVWAFVQTAFIPWTGAAIAAKCALKNCVDSRL